MEPIVLYTAGAAILFVAVLLIKPLRSLLKVVVNASIGCVALFAFNFIGGFIGMSIGVNIFTALAIGILGIPGFIMLFVLQIIYV